MDISSLHQPDGVNAASALESLAHRLVAVQNRKPPESRGGRRVVDIVDLPVGTGNDLGLDLLDAAPQPGAADGLIGRMLRFFRS
jgi:hypothetical protein